MRRGHQAATVVAHAILVDFDFPMFNCMGGTTLGGGIMLVFACHIVFSYQL